MSHSDPGTLALAALGEEIPAADAAHLASCAQCQREVDELAAVVSVAREAPRLTAPPDAVWDAIRAEIGTAPATAGPTPLDTSSAPAAPVVPLRDDAAAAGGTVPAGPSDHGEDGPARAGQAAPPRAGDAAGIFPLRRRRLVSVAAIAAMFGAVLGGAVVWAAVGRTPQQPRQEAVIAQAVLKPLSPTVTQPGEAQVLESADGLVVRVDARGLPPGTGFHEVWLLDADATKLVALGALPGGSVGTFTVPPGLDVADFPVVDISLEPYDGDPRHSHDSLLRGVLEA
jgi:Anti-sigma-K factor rskA, C-terminal